MINLPFKMNFIFDFTEQDNINKDIFVNLISELKEIEPFPDIQIYIKNPELIKTISDSIICQIPYELNIVFSNDLTIDNLTCEKYNFICNLNNVDKALSFINNNPSINWKNIIINHSETCLNEIDLKSKLNIIKNINTPNIFLKPYLTEKEIINYYTGDKQNRGFLSCAACWLSPIIKNNGDVFCCKYNKIGNLEENSFWFLWNGEFANQIRSSIVNNKQLKRCNHCNLFYKDSFLIVENCDLEYKDIVYQFPSNLNYILSAPEVIITNYKKVDNKHYQVNLFPIFSDEEMINNCKDVLLVLK